MSGYDLDQLLARSVRLDKAEAEIERLRATLAAERAGIIRLTALLLWCRCRLSSDHGALLDQYMTEPEPIGEEDQYQGNMLVP